MKNLVFEENDSDHLLENQVNLLKDYFALYIKYYSLDDTTSFFCDFFNRSLLDIVNTDYYKSMYKRGILCVCADNTISLHIWKKKVMLGKVVPFKTGLKSDVLRDFISEAALEYIVETLLKKYSGNLQTVIIRLSLFIRRNDASVFGIPVLSKMAEHVGVPAMKRVIALNGCHHVSEYVALVKRNAAERKNNEHVGNSNGTYDFKVKSKNGDRLSYTFKRNVQ